MAGGRPTDYSLELSDIICMRLADGESMRSVCRDDSMPAMTTVFRWLREKDEFRKQYAIAKDESADSMMEDTLDIADNQVGSIAIDEDDNVITDKNGEPVRRIDGPAVAHAKLRVDTRKWAASKLKPKKYGDKLVLGGDPESPVQLVGMTAEEYKAARKEMIESDDC